MIYLRCPVRVLQRRIRGRGRSFERSVPKAYLESLHALYEAWFERYVDSPSIVVQTDRVDYVEHLFDRQELLERIRAELG
jgi:deoxyadenosine/deoxycytidine kinase